MKKFPFDVALSFAEEDLSKALSLYLALKLTKGENTIFYYKKSLYTSGKLLKTELPLLYKEKAQFVLMLISENYVNKEKVYAPIEAEAIIQRWKFDPNESFLIPVLIDDTPLEMIDPSLTKEVAYIKWDHDPEALAEKIWELVRKKQLDKKNQKKKNGESTDGNYTTVKNKIEGDVKDSVLTGINNGVINYSKK